MKAIYAPKGAAAEYAKLACNPFSGCTHGCTYCYAPGVLHKEKQEFHNQSLLRPGIFDALRRDASAMAARGDKTPVMFSFTTDIYQENTCGFARMFLKIMKDEGVPFHVLTKGGSRALRDFDLYFDGCAFGTSLCLVSEELRQQWEPRAACFDDRLHAIKKACEAGIHTFLSLEPVVDTGEALDVIRLAAPYVKEFRVGKLNHHKAALETDWKAFARDVVALLVSLQGDFGFDWFLKKELAEYTGDEGRTHSFVVSSYTAECVLCGEGKTVSDIADLYNAGWVRGEAPDYLWRCPGCQINFG